MHGRESFYVDLGIFKPVWKQEGTQLAHQPTRSSAGGTGITEDFNVDPELNDNRTLRSWWQHVVGCFVGNKNKRLSKEWRMSSQTKFEVDARIGPCGSSELGFGSGSGTGDTYSRSLDASIGPSIYRYSGTETLRAITSIRVRPTEWYKGLLSYELIGHSNASRGSVTLTPMFLKDKTEDGSTLVRKSGLVYSVTSFLSPSWDSTAKVIKGYTDSIEEFTGRLQHALTMIIGDGHTEFTLDLDSLRWGNTATQMEGLMPVLARMVYQALYHIDSERSIKIFIKQTPALIDLFCEEYRRYRALCDIPGLGKGEDDQNLSHEYVTTPESQEVSYKATMGRKPTNLDDYTQVPYLSRGERDNPTERSQSGSLRNSPSLSRDPTHSRTVRQGIPPRQEVASEMQHSSEDLFCDWCETSVATLHNIRGPDGIVKQVCPTCRDICVARARAAKEEESQQAYNLKRRKEELRSAMELKEYEITCEEEIARRRARSKDYDDSGSPKRRDEDSRAPVGRSKTQPVNGGNSSRPTNARGGKGGKGYVTGVSWPFEPSASRECEEEDQHEEDEDNDAEEENSDDDMGDESAKSVISQVSNKSGRNRFRLPRPDPPEDDLDSVFDAASLEEELLTMTRAEALDFKIKIANLKAIREQTGHHRQKSSDDKAQITRDEVAWGTSQTQAHEHYGRTALNKLKQPTTPPSAGEVAQALLDLWNHAYRLGKERYQTVSRYPLIIYMFSVFMRPISEWLHPLERTTSSSTSFVKKAYTTIPTKFINSLLEAWGFSSGTKIGQLEYLRISASVGTQTPQFEEIKQASEYVRSILYRLGDIWPFKKAMKDFKTCMFTQAYTSACHEPSQAVWIMVQWCREKSDLCRKAYAFTVQKYLHDYFAEVKSNRSRKTKTIIIKGYHRYVSYVADQWRRKYTGTPRLQDIEALIDLKDSSPNAIGSEPSVLTIFIEELPDTEEWRALTFKVTGKAITTDDIYGSRPDNNQYSHLFQNVDAYFSWLLGVGREIEESSRLKARDHFTVPVTRTQHFKSKDFKAGAPWATQSRTPESIPNGHRRCRA